MKINCKKVDEKTLYVKGMFEDEIIFSVVDKNILVSTQDGLIIAEKTIRSDDEKIVGTLVNGGYIEWCKDISIPIIQKNPEYRYFATWMRPGDLLLKFTTFCIVHIKEKLYYL